MLAIFKDEVTEELREELKRQQAAMVRTWNTIREQQTLRLRAQTDGNSGYAGRIVSGIVNFQKLLMVPLGVL